MINVFIQLIKLITKVLILPLNLNYIKINYINIVGQSLKSMQYN